MKREAVPTAAASPVQGSYTNPILSGSYPDPSICRVGDDYYLANSSFEYFPGLPLHHSKDLVNWELVGYGLQRESQCRGAINLADVQSRGGIHAPSLRYHQGSFWLIATHVYLPPGEGQATRCINFILQAQNIAGPWSEPHVLEGAPGIDPDIFFDEDGKVWYVGTHSPAHPNFEGEGEIWLQEIDLEHWQLVGERFYLWRGACGGMWVEGPHLYKRDGRYYLMVAEGGTSFNHAVMIAVSERITGPYRANPRNPILTARHLSYDHWVNSTGHADMVEAADGRWFMVTLGIRGEVRRASNMGRETHLLPLVWEREPFEWQEVKIEWPVCAPLSGCVERLNPLPFENTTQALRAEFKDDFEQAHLGLAWNFRRMPLPGSYSTQARPGYLRLLAQAASFGERERCCFLGIRQKESEFEFTVQMETQAQEEGVESGVCLFQQDDKYLSYTLLRQSGQVLLQLALAEPAAPVKVIRQAALHDFNGEIIFRVISEYQCYRYQYSLDRGRHYAPFGETRADHLLSTGYTGAYLGLYASSHGKPTQAYADFDWVVYR